MAGQPRKRSGKICGARTQKGTPCRSLMLFKGNPPKCKWHGGLSTGPKTPEGKARSLAARDAGLKRYLEQRRISNFSGISNEAPSFPKDSG